MEPVFFRYDVEKNPKTYVEKLPKYGHIWGRGQVVSFAAVDKTRSAHAARKMSKKGANRQLRYSEMSREQQLCSHDRI